MCLHQSISLYLCFLFFRLCIIIPVSYFLYVYMHFLCVSISHYLTALLCFYITLFRFLFVSFSFFFLCLRIPLSYFLYVSISSLCIPSSLNLIVSMCIHLSLSLSASLFISLYLCHCVTLSHMLFVYFPFLCVTSSVTIIVTLSLIVSVSLSFCFIVHLCPHLSLSNFLSVSSFTPSNPLYALLFVSPSLCLSIPISPSLNFSISPSLFSLFVYLFDAIGV